MAFAHRKETYKATPFHHKESSNEMWKAHLKKRCLDKLQERKEVIKNQLETMKRNNSNSPISPSSFPTTSFENNLNFNNNNNSSFSPNFIGSSNLFGNNNDIDMTTSNTNNSLHSSQTIMEDSSSIEKNQSSIIFNNSNNVNNNNNFFVNISNVHSKQPNQVTQQQNPITQQTTQNNKNNDENFLVSELINQEWKQIQRIENFETNQQIKALSPFSTPTYPNWDAENFDIGIIQEVETEIWNELQEDEEAVFLLHLERNLLGQDFLWCPLCMKKQLIKLGPTFYCSCGCRIDVSNNLSSAQLRSKIESQVQSHNMFCMHQPTFASTNDPGKRSISINCNHCNFHQIV